MEEKKQRKYMPSAKELIHYCTTIILIISIFLAFKYRLQNVEEKVSDNTELLHDNNLELIKYQVDEIKKDQEKLINKNDEIIKTLNDILAKHIY